MSHVHPYRDHGSLGGRFSRHLALPEMETCSHLHRTWWRPGGVKTPRTDKVKVDPLNDGRPRGR